MAAISDALRHDLQQPEFSEGYAESFLDTFIATQLKVLREQNRWSQTQLAEKMGKKQTVISRSENVNYSSWSISTLKQYARAFRLRLRVSFETYGSLIDEVSSFSRENLQRAPRESDPDLAGSAPKAKKDAPVETPPIGQLAPGRMPESSAQGTANVQDQRPNHRARLLGVGRRKAPLRPSVSDLLRGQAQEAS
jgi:transcriptional regulator with XRE-family HTH domain